MGRTTAPCFGPSPLGPCGGSKRSNFIKFQLQSQFQRFLNHNLYDLSRMKIYNISEGIFIQSPGAYPRDGTWVYLGDGGQIFNVSEVQPNLACELLR